MATSNLLFHGTAAVSVWTSYLRAAHLNKTLLRKSINVLDQYFEKLEQPNQRIPPVVYFARHGPAYPYEGHKPQVCLTTSLNEAFGYTNWEGRPESQSLTFKNQYNHRFYVHPDSPLRMPGFDEKIFTPEALGHFRQTMHSIYNQDDYWFKTPGALLVVNHNYLAENGLLMPALDEESYRAAYLPWRSIIGVAFVEWKDKMKSFNINGFIPRRPNAWADFQACLTDQRLNGNTSMP